MEKSLNMNIGQKSWNFVISHRILPISPPNCTKFAHYFATTKKSNFDIESLHFPMFSAKYCKYKIEKRDGHGKLRNSHGKVMKKYFVKSVGTLYLYYTLEVRRGKYRVLGVFLVQYFPLVHI